MRAGIGSSEEEIKKFEGLTRVSLNQSRSLINFDLTSANIDDLELPEYASNIVNFKFKGFQDQLYSYFHAKILEGDYEAVKKCIEDGADLRISTGLIDSKALNIFDLCAPDVDDDIEKIEKKFQIFKELFNCYRYLRANYQSINQFKLSSPDIQTINYENFDELDSSFEKTKKKFLENELAKKSSKIKRIDQLKINKAEFERLNQSLLASPETFIKCKLYQFSIYSQIKSKSLHENTEKNMFIMLILNCFNEFKFLALRSSCPSIFMDDLVERFIKKERGIDPIERAFELNCVNSKNLFLSSEYDEKIIHSGIRFNPKHKQNALNILLFYHNFKTISAILELTNSLNKTEADGSNIFDKVLMGVKNFLSTDDERIEGIHNLLFFGAILRSTQDDSKYIKLRKKIINFMSPIPDEDLGKFIEMINLLDRFVQEFDMRTTLSGAKQSSRDFIPEISRLNYLAKMYISEKSPDFGIDLEGSIAQSANLIKTQKHKFYSTSLAEFKSSDELKKINLSLNYVGFIRYVYELGIYEYVYCNLEKSSNYKEFITSCDQLIDLLPMDSEIVIAREKLRKAKSEIISRLEEDIKLFEANIVKEQNKLAKISELEDDLKLITDELNGEIKLERKRLIKKLISDKISELEEDLKLTTDQLNKIIISSRKKVIKEWAKKETLKTLEDIRSISDESIQQIEQRFPSKTNSQRAKLEERFDAESQTEITEAISTDLSLKDHDFSVDELDDRKLFNYQDLICKFIMIDEIKSINMFRANKLYLKALLLKNQVGISLLEFAFIYGNSEFLKKFYELHQELAKSNEDFKKILFDENPNFKNLLELFILNDEVTQNEKIEKLNFVFSKLSSDQKKELLNASDNLFNTALKLSINKQQFELAKLLIENGVNGNLLKAQFYYTSADHNLFYELDNIFLYGDNQFFRKVYELHQQLAESDEDFKKILFDENPNFKNHLFFFINNTHFSEEQKIERLDFIFSQIADDKRKELFSSAGNIFDDIVRFLITSDQLKLAKLLLKNKVSSFLTVRDNDSYFELDKAFVFYDFEYFKKLYKLHQELAESDDDFRKILFDENPNFKNSLWNLIQNTELSEHQKIERLEFVFSQITDDKRKELLSVTESDSFIPINLSFMTRQFELAKLLISSGSDVSFLHIPNIQNYHQLDMAFVQNDLDYFISFYELHQELAKTDEDFRKTLFDQNPNFINVFWSLLMNVKPDSDLKIEKFDFAFSQLSEDQKKEFLNTPFGLYLTLPLSYLIETRQLELAEYFIKNGAELELKDFKKSGIIKMVDFNQLDFFKALDQKGLINYSEMSSEFVEEMRKYCVENKFTDEGILKSDKKTKIDLDFFRIIENGFNKARVHEEPSSVLSAPKTIKKTEKATTK